MSAPSPGAAGSVAPRNARARPAMPGRVESTPGVSIRDTAREARRGPVDAQRVHAVDAGGPEVDHERAPPVHDGQLCGRRAVAVLDDDPGGGRVR